MSEYLTLMKQASNNLALARALVEREDLKSFVVSGLDVDYLPITCQIYKNDLTWQELSSTLNTFEDTLVSLNVIYEAVISVG